MDRAIGQAVDWFLHQQRPEGFWVGMLESNATMEAEWLLAFHFLGHPYPHVKGLVKGILERQRGDGAWETYYDAPAGDMNATVECYAALRMVGMPAEAAPLRRARDWILGHGGLRRTRVFTRYWLALIGQWPWRHTPNIPPEIIRLPLWVPFNIYHFAQWARATMMPIALLSASRPVRPLPPDRRLDELFPDGRERFDYRLPRKGRALSWERFFLGADRALHWLQERGWTPGRRRSVAQVIEWIIRHQDADGAWGGIQPPWIYGLMALYNEGYPLSHPVLRKGLEALEAHWSYERDGARYIQASESPVWDTLLGLLALDDAGALERDPAAVERAVDWILDHEVRFRGDWAVKLPDVEPGGWAFERANLHYPDVDDTAVALIVLARLRDRYRDPARIDAALERARNWVLAMQSRNGGWAAFDKDNDDRILTRIPFSDFGETLDPPSVDVTAHVLEGLAALGLGREHPAVARALDYIRGEQEPDGSWFGRWGVNHLYGTAAVLPALAAVGVDMRERWVRRAADWVAERQNEDGGWGETCASYMDPALRGRGVSTASQTAWALMALLAVDPARYAAAVHGGIRFLIDTQIGGTWEEPYYTGTGFPGYGVGERVDLHQADPAAFDQGCELSRGFMINYNLYRHYFPLMALGRARRVLTG